MKTTLKILFVSFALIALTGCGNDNKEVVTHCTLTSNNTVSGYKLASEYNVYSVNGEVNKVVTEEVVSSDDQETLNYFEEYIKNTYTAQNSTYGGVDNKIVNENGKVTSTTTIDYSKMDLEKYVEDNSALKSYVNDNNKLKVDGVISLYEAMGAICE